MSLFSSAEIVTFPDAVFSAVPAKDEFVAKLSVSVEMAFTASDAPNAFPSASVETANAPVYELIFASSVAATFTASSAFTVTSFKYDFVTDSIRFTLIWPAPAFPFPSPLPLPATFVIVSSLSAETVSASSISFSVSSSCFSFFFVPRSVSVALSMYASFVLSMAL